MVGYFDTDKSVDFESYRKVASVLRDDCSFHAATGQVYHTIHTQGGPLTNTDTHRVDH